MNAVLQYIEDNQKRFVEDLCQYVRFPSVSAQPEHRADMATCAEWLVKHCQEIGLEADVRPTAGHPVVVAKTKRTGKPPYLVYGHYDLAHLNAVEAYLKTNTELPCDLTFVIEGEEEVGSKHLEGFLQANKKELACRAVVISDTGMPSLKHPALTYALRGIIAFEVILHGPSRDLHSGILAARWTTRRWLCARCWPKCGTKTGASAFPAFTMT